MWYLVLRVAIRNQGGPHVFVMDGSERALGVASSQTHLTIAAQAWNDGGGGFSDTFAAPSYQLSAVATCAFPFPSA